MGYSARPCHFLCSGHKAYCVFTVPDWGRYKYSKDTITSRSTSLQKILNFDGNVTFVCFFCIAVKSFNLF